MHVGDELRVHVADGAVGSMIEGGTLAGGHVLSDVLGTGRPGKVGERLAAVGGLALAVETGVTRNTPHQ